VSLNIFVPPKLCCPEKFVSDIYQIKNKNLVPLIVHAAFPTSKPGYRLALFQLTLSNSWHSGNSHF